MCMRTGRGLAVVAQLTIGLAIMGLVLAAHAPRASAAITFGTFGAGPGQTNSPKGLAVDESTGELYVADSGNNRIEVFGSAGNFLRVFGAEGNGSGQFQDPTAVAVDSDAVSSSYRDVYVNDNGNHRIEKFKPSGEFILMFGDGVNQTSGGDVCPRPGFPADVCGPGVGGFGPGQLSQRIQVAVAPGGNVYVVDSLVSSKDTNRIQVFDASGTFLSEEVLLEPHGDAVGLAVDRSTGDFYFGDTAYDEGPGAIRKYPPTGSPAACEFNQSSNIGGLSTDAFDSLFFADNTEANSLYEYDSSCVQQLVFGYGSLDSHPRWIAAFHSTDGDVFASQGSGQSSKIVYIDLPQPGPLVLPEPGRTVASPIGNVRATLKATINPEGKASTVSFEYVDDAACQKALGEVKGCFEEAKKSATVPAGEDFKLHQVEVEIGCQDAENEAEVAAGKCLSPDTLYHFRAIAFNEDAPSEGNAGPEAAFKARPALEITNTYTTDVGLDAAVLSATVDPLGIAATGFFEYVDDAACRVGIKASGDCFEGASKTASVDFGSSEERVSRGVQVLSLAPGTIYHYRLVASDSLVAKIAGPEQVFTTFPRPPLLTCPNEGLRGGLAAKLPDCRGYELVTPVEKENGDIVVLLATDNNAPAELPQASAAGDRLTYSSYRPFADAQSGPYTVQYLAGRNAEGGWTNHAISPPREGISFYPARGLDTQFRAFSEDLCSGWLLHDAEPVLGQGGVKGYGNLYRRENCAGESYEALSRVIPPVESSKEYAPEIVGFSEAADLSVYRANDKLTKNAASKPEIYQLYGFRRPRVGTSDGELRLVSVLPGGVASVKNSSAGGGAFNAFRNGRLEHAVSTDGSRIFWTAVNDATGTGDIYLRENPFGSGPECSGPAAPCTLPVSGSVAEGAGKAAQFWTAAADGSKALFSFIEGGLAGNLYEYDVASKASTLIAGKAEGVLGASDDASRVYFASSEALAPGAKAGGANIYLYEANSIPTFITVAAVPSAGVGGYCSNVSAEPIDRCSRVSRDGNQLAFTSQAALTGYDNTDARTGDADAEVYLYDAVARGGEGELLCISCNPTGARPTGRALRRGGGDFTAVAAKIPLPTGALHASRALSDGGQRLFFESFDALVPGDNNGFGDVYEWEAAGSKTECEERGAGLYAPDAGGCLSLISSGQGARDSEFVDASASGDDVFFKTAASILPQDSDLIDIYDARVQGGFAPPSSPAPPCQGEACQAALVPPAPITPSSFSFHGTGNLKPKKKPRKNKKHKKHHHKQAGHRRGAAR